MSASLLAEQEAYHRLSAARGCGRCLLASPFAPLRARADRHVINENSLRRADAMCGRKRASSGACSTPPVVSADELGGGTSARSGAMRSRTKITLDVVHIRCALGMLEVHVASGGRGAPRDVTLPTRRGPDKLGPRVEADDAR
jgi:hypothetical protein